MKHYNQLFFILGALALCLVGFQNCDIANDFKRMPSNEVHDPGSTINDNGQASDDASSDTDMPNGDDVPVDVGVAEIKIALLGDTEAGSNFGEALKLAASEKAGVIMINGDLGYNDSPNTWRNRAISSIDINQHLVIGSLGNHDVEDSADAYPPIFASFRNETNQLKSTCSGLEGISEGHDIVAVDEVCTFGNVSIIASGIGQVLSDSYLENRMAQKLSSAPRDNWKLVGYHYTLSSMNPGIKGNENTYKFFDLIRQHGAIGAQAHTHTVMASCPISSLFASGNPVQCHEDFGPDLSQRYVAPGIGMYMDSSLGGKGARALERCTQVGENNCAHLVDLVGEQGYVRVDGVTDSGFSDTGVLFITFNAGGNPSLGYVYYKTVDGKTVFAFYISR